ncbi:hypothetical protein AY599_00865 [Leptolyngbya valderiana BDU 20041]|nr:hypothetical protein AY599_00865 [Leptolyngbya valderiana BDU 20041]
MQQQVQLSPKPPEADARNQAPREREVRVQADAAAFGMLLGAFQGGEAGIVRGEVRNDSAAEWNAQDAREGRQDRREHAQGARPGAQESRVGLERLAADARQQSARPAAAPEEVAAPATRGEPVSHAAGQERAAVSGQGTNAEPRGMGEGRAGNESSTTQARPPSSAAVAVASVQSVGATTAGRVNVTGAQAPAVDAARGPQGGAARGRAQAPVAQRADQSLRFEKAFQAQVGRGLAQALQSGQGEVTLRLRPESLGQLSVRVRVEQNQVTATFEARHAEAKRMLEGSRDALRQQLESRGLTVERIEVRLVEEPAQAGTRLAMHEDGGADGGQDGHAFAGDRDGRGASDGDGADGGSRRGAAREDDELAAVGAEPWRSLGTVRLNAIA